MYNNKKKYKNKNMLFSFLLWIIYWFFIRLFFRFKFKNKEKLPIEGPAIIAINHTSVYDMFPIMYFSKAWIHWLSKSELYESKGFMGWAMKFGQVLPVDRTGINISYTKNIIKALHANRVIGVFPEATTLRSREEVLKQPIRSGAAYLAAKFKCPVYPIGISTNYKIFGKFEFVVGDPYTIDIPMVKWKEHEEELSLDMMKRIYALTDMETDYLELRKNH